MRGRSESSRDEDGEFLSGRVPFLYRFGSVPSTPLREVSSGLRIVYGVRGLGVS